jgi:hypothetical protein
MTRPYARAPRGQRAYGSVPRNHGRPLSVIGALGVQGMGASMRVEGAVDTDVCDVFVARGLVTARHPADIVRLDNLSVPPASCSEQAVKEVRGAVLLLPPYSPDFSPLEQWWAKVNTCLRTCAARTRQRLERALTKAFHIVQPEDSLGWFRHCGYLVSSECKPL